jgi:anaerobic magnesium-protoporphyrin IX monomethyl ester cyclase
MKIVLLHPPVPCMTDRKVSPPLGILYLAAYVRQHLGITPVVIDQNLNDDITLDVCTRQVVDEHADIYGVSFGSTQYPYVVAIVKAIRDHYPHAVVLLGGPHATSLPAETLAETGADAVVESEGEETFLALVERLLAGRRDFSDITGLFLPTADGGMTHTGRRPFIKDLNAIPYPARDLVPFHQYTRTILGEGATTLITSRGCPAQCIFCSQAVWRRRIRLRSVSNIIGEIDQIRSQFGINNFLFLDDTLTIDRKRVVRISRELKARKSTWRGWTRASHVDQEMLDVMADAGCMTLCIGVESGSQRILDGLKKGTTVEQNRRGIEMVKRSGMYSRISLIVGSPGETWDTVNETVSFVSEARPDDWVLSSFVPVPGSEAFADPRKFGIRMKPAAAGARGYEDFFVVGGEMQSGHVMEYDGLDAATLGAMRDHVYATLMERCPPKLQTFKGIQ